MLKSKLTRYLLSAAIIAGVLPAAATPPPSGTSAMVVGTVVAVSPYLVGGPLFPPVEAGCTYSVDTGGETFAVLLLFDTLPDLLCASSVVGLRAAITAQLDDTYCQLDTCVQRLTVVATGVALYAPAVRPDDADG